MELKKDWEIKKLGEVCQIKGGKRIPKGKKLLTEKTLHPYIRVTDFTDDGTVSLSDIHYISDEIYETIKQYTITTSDVFISIAGTIGKVGVIPVELNNANLTENACKLILNDRLYNKYLVYVFQSDKIKAITQDNARANAMPKLSLTRLSNIEIPVPPLEEQKRIVKILDEKFAQLESLKANAQTNLQNAKDLFLSQLAKAFTNTTWEKKRLGDVCEIRPSKSETTKYLSDDDNVSFLPMEDLQIMNYYIEPKQSKKLKEVSGSYTCFANGDVLLAKVTPCFENGKQGIAKDLTNGVGFGSSEYIVFRPASELLSEYLYYSLATSDFRENGKKHLLGACGLKRLSKDYVNEYNIPLPPLPEQKRIVKELDTLSEKVRLLQEIYTKQIANCDELKQAYLQKAFEGEL